MKAPERAELVGASQGFDATVHMSTGKQGRFMCSTCRKMRATDRDQMCRVCANRLRRLNGLPALGPDVNLVTEVRPPKHIDPHRLRKYGLTPYTFRLLAEEQGGRCAICRMTPQSIGEFVVDHNHRTGDVRGLLCLPCNTGIGHLKDSPDVLRRAVTYLESLGYYGPDLEADA